MKKANKWIIIGLIIAVAGGGYWWWSKKNTVTSTPTSREVTVTRGNIASELSVQGQAEMVNEQTMRFTQSGTVKTIMVKAGDQIKKDDLIASLDLKDLNNDIKQNEISLANAQSRLRDLEDGNTTAQKLSAQNTVQELEKKMALAEANLTVATSEATQSRTDLERQIQVATTDLANKKKALETSTAEYETAAATNQDTALDPQISYQATLVESVSKAKNIAVTMTNILTDLNNVLAQDTGTEKINADFVNYLGALDFTTWNKAKASYYLAKQAAVATAQLTVTPTPESLETYLTELNHTLNLTATATDDTYALVKASISGPSYSQSQLDSLQSKLNSDRGTCQNQLTTISGLQTTIRNLSDPGLTTAQNNNDLQRKYDSLQSAKLAVTQAENTLKKLQDAYPSELKTIENNLQDKKDNLTNLQNQVKAQQASLSDILRGATDEELTQTRNEVVLKELALSKAKEQITKYELRAPFDGVVSTIDYKVGDNIVADDSKYVYLQNPNLMQVIISLDQIDIVKVQTNMSATITFDALAEQSFAGTVTALDPAPVEQSGVVSYNVTVTLDKGTANLYSGMTATVKINLGKKENVLLLPSRALVTQGEQVLVNKLVNGQIVATPVVTGLSDEQNTEIISGLSEQDRVLINSQRTSTSSTTSSSSNNQNSDAMRQVMRVTSSGGGGGPPTP